MEVGSENEGLSEEEVSLLMNLERLIGVRYSDQVYRVYFEKMVAGDKIYVSCSVVSLKADPISMKYHTVGGFYDLKNNCFIRRRGESESSEFRAFLNAYEPIE